jgi:hypothetical protein
MTGQTTEVRHRTKTGGFRLLCSRADRSPPWSKRKGVVPAFPWLIPAFFSVFLGAHLSVWSSVICARIFLASSNAEMEAAGCYCLVLLRSCHWADIIWIRLHTHFPQISICCSGVKHLLCVCVTPFFVKHLKMLCALQNWIFHLNWRMEARTYAQCSLTRNGHLVHPLSFFFSLVVSYMPPKLSVAFGDLATLFESLSGHLNGLIKE